MTNNIHIEKTPHELRWLRADGIDPTNLTAEEANELDTLIFRIAADLPFGDVEEARTSELKAKAAGQPFVGGFISAIDELPPPILSSEHVLPKDHPIFTAPNISGNFTSHTIQFTNNGKPALTITADGELEFENVTEAALALKAEWDRLRGEA